jgi:hypothetical protein
LKDKPNQGEEMGTNSWDKKLLLAGHTLTTLGFFAFSLSKLSRLFIDGDLPEEPIFEANRTSNVDDLVSRSFEEDPSRYRW